MVSTYEVRTGVNVLDEVLVVASRGGGEIYEVAAVTVLPAVCGDWINCYQVIGRYPRPRFSMNISTADTCIMLTASCSWPSVCVWM